MPGAFVVLFSPVLYVFHDILHAAGEDAAEHFDRVGADALVSLHARNLSGADVVLLDQRILCNAFFLHGFP